jgi:NAD(P)-dependent dehydrogenase (short-subunit alcohol dehydrogenase family)
MGDVDSRLGQGPAVNCSNYTPADDKDEQLIPVGRVGSPEDVAGPTTFLASRDADYVNGVLLFVDGGQLA